MAWNDKFLVANQSIVAMRNKYNIPVNIRLTEITTDISFVSWTFLIQDKFTRSQFLKKSDEKRSEEIHEKKGKEKNSLGNKSNEGDEWKRVRDNIEKSWMVVRGGNEARPSR